MKPIAQFIIQDLKKEGVKFRILEGIGGNEHSQEATLPESQTYFYPAANV